MYDTLKPGDVVVADSLYDDYFVVWDLRDRGIDIVARVKHQRAHSHIVESSPDGDILVWQRPQRGSHNLGTSQNNQRTERDGSSFTLTRVCIPRPALSGAGSLPVRACHAPLSLKRAHPTAIGHADLTFEQILETLSGRASTPIKRVTP